MLLPNISPRLFPPSVLHIVQQTHALFHAFLYDIDDSLPLVIALDQIHPQNVFFDLYAFHIYKMTFTLTNFTNLTHFKKFHA